MRNILQYILKILAKIALWRYRPVIIGVTGSVGKTSAKEAIYTVLKQRFRVRRNYKNYNNEIGAPLTILGLDKAGSSILLWLGNFIKSILTIIWDWKYPEILILEMGVDKPNDMKYLINFIPVKVGVFTAIGEFPSHIEFFPEKEKLVEEKSLLIKSLPDDGLAVFNYDDLSVRELGHNLPEKIKIIYYGFGQGAGLRIENYELKITSLENNDFGVNFKLNYGGSVVPVWLPGILGKQHVFASAAAASIGLFFNLNLVEISASLKGYSCLPGRTNLIKGIKQTWIIDDTYNASPLSVEAGLDMLNELASKFSEPNRKIAILGDMLELGAETEAGHRKIGRKAVKTTDLLFTVGDRARFISNEAVKNGFKKENVFESFRSEDAGLPLQEEMRKGDIILVKGSRSMCMEKIVKEIIAEPEKAEKILVH